MSYAATKEATSAAIRKADEGADPEWKAAADAAIDDCARALKEFTADDVWGALEQNGVAIPAVPSALGPVFIRAAKADKIFNTGRRLKQSIYPRRHRELTIWQSKI